jgi:hypothetical protein
VLAISLFLTAISCALLWVGLVAPALMRAVGIPLSGGLWRRARRNQHLSKGQYVWAYGIFSYGIGMFLFMTVLDYLQWKLMGDAYMHRDAKHIFINLLIWLAGGCFVGVMAYRHRPDADLSGN